MRGFGSDNHSGAHPRIMDAIAKANVGHAPSYGTDPWTERACEMMKNLFGKDAETFFVFNGTAANVLALGALVKPHHAVLTAASSHLINDEAGAPEKNLGCKVTGIPSQDGKITPEMIKPYLIRRGDQHASQVKVISITQPTELGTLYSLDEMKALGAFAKAERLYFHVDGARFVNAIEALNCSFSDLTSSAGVDVLSLGGTKNGLLYGETVVFLKKGLSEDFKFARKQLMQLPSKTRFLAAQFLEFLGTDLWRENAKHSRLMAMKLYDGLKKSRYAEPTQIPQANGVFVKLPKRLVSRLKETAFFYVWDEHTFECRLMTTWDTQSQDIDAFLAALERLGSETESDKSRV
jgi:threonine aldolase